MEGPKPLCASWEAKKARSSKLSAQQLSEKLDTILEDSEAEEDGTTQINQSGTGKVSATSRSSTKRISAVVSKWKNSQKETLLTEMAFQGVMDLPQINKVDPEFTFWLLRRVDPIKRGLWIDATTFVKLRDIDYHRVLGIPCGKLPVCGLGSKDPEDKIDFINLCVGTSGAKEEYCSLKAAERNVEKVYQEPMDKMQCENFKVSFVVWLVCRWLAPIRKPNNGSETFWGALLKPDEISCYNWCAFALEALFDAVRKFQNDITSKIKIANLSLCPMFLQIFFLDYLKNGGMNIKPCRIPRIADYDYQTISSMIQSLNDKMQQELDLKKKLTESDTYTLDTFQQAVGECKLATKKKIALRWYGASLQRHVLMLRSSIFRDAIKLVQKLEAEDGTDDEGPSAPTRKRIVDGYTSGTESATEDGTSARKKKKESAFRDESNPTFSLGFSDDEEDDLAPSKHHGGDPGTSAEKKTNNEEGLMHRPSTLQTTECHIVDTQTLAIQQQTHIPTLPLSLEDVNLPKLDGPTFPADSQLIKDHVLVSTNFSTPNTKACSSTTSTCQDLIQASTSGDMVQSFVTPATKGDSSKCISPATVTKCWSESELMHRMEPWDDQINLNCKSLSFEFTDSPVAKKKAMIGKVARSPWSQGLLHPKRDGMLISNFVNWLRSTSSEELVRQWVMHALPRYVELTGFDMKNMLCGRTPLSYSMFDVAIRRLNQLDRLMHAVNHLIHWRHILESDFAMLVLAGEKVTTNSSVRKQFMGETVLHQIENCRMITIPALVRDTWCAYFCDMKLKTMHVIDPLYKLEDHSSFGELHEPNVRSLKGSLAECFNDFFEGWNPNLQDWGVSYVKPLIQNAEKVDSGVLTLMAVRDFNGKDFTSAHGQDSLDAFKGLLLHEVLSILGNDAKTPSKFVEYIDLE